MRQVAACAPGRINLIGEHTDYNDGFVMPMAIDFATTVEARSREDRVLTISSEQFADEKAQFDLDALPDGPQQRWTDCVRGMLVELQREGLRFPGLDLRITSTIPVGAGLSSSAALEVAAGLAILELTGTHLDRITLAKIAQRDEHRQMGTRSGIMDQYVSAKARAGEALLIDTRELTDRGIPIPDAIRILICNTMVKHELAGSEYNRRREDCEAGVAALRVHDPQIQALRDATMGQLDAIKERIDPLVYRRCRHVITENTRVLQAAKALEDGDVRAFGALMDASHKSLRDDYEVSSTELDTMVELARACEGVYGARMTGGGFGGCAIVLVERDRLDRVAEVVTNGYEREFGVKPELYRSAAAAGAQVLAA
ncbi:MAG: galactokinase [Vulcanimicrobiaceae bacterium]